MKLYGWWIEKCVWLLLVISLLRQLPDVVSVRQTDFDHYLTAAKKLIQNENIYYDLNADWHRDHLDTWYIYPPYFAAILYPLASIQEFYAKVIYVNCNVVFILLIDWILILLRRWFAGISPIQDILVHGLVLFAYPTFLLIWSFQIEGLVFLLFLMSLYAMIHRYSIGWTVCFYMIGSMVKLWPASFGFTLLSIYKTKVVYWLLGLVALWLVLFTVLIGFESQWYYLVYMLPNLLSYTDMYLDNQSLSRFIRLFISPHEWTAPLVRLAVFGSFLIATLRNWNALSRNEETAILVNACLFCAVSLLITPTTWTASHIRLLLPLLVSFVLCLNDTRFAAWFGFPVLASLVCYIYPQDDTIHGIPYIIHRYSMLLAALIQFVLFLVISLRPDMVSSTPIKHSPSSSS